ncbi:hypothetical protein GCK72_008151 [Caenorhabditis remanei]|uniref:Uncharacterized protein n=1 Tax=Caenorhabditis remanei TaxID=31234 RepID=A0A6A5GZF6_CAERE|nr:hypothetical protein GCK72_008151 [Caenorhabditis remanei]KAF1759906.1 hypothetical protein GCK72_008151 [Caenorhabditis remanei]
MPSKYFRLFRKTPRLSKPFDPLIESEIPAIDESDATSSAMTSTSRGYQRVDSSDVGSLLMEEGDNPHEALLHRNNDDYASTYHHVGVEYDSYEELERHEMDDRVAEIPEGFHRRQRRRVTRAGLGRAEYYEDNHIHSCDKEDLPENPHVCPYAKKKRRRKVYIENEEVELELELSLISAMVSGHEDIDDESDDESKDEDEEEEETGIRKFAKLVLPHVALVLLTCTYTVIGALIFYSVEQPHEQMMKEQQLKMYRGCHGITDCHTE